MLITTLCYIEHNNHYLMLHRTKKAHDINEGKWIGVGGKFIDRESPEECLLREVKEETGWRLTNWRFRGFITFLQENYETEYMCLYTADDFQLPDASGPDSTAGSAGSAESGPEPSAEVTASGPEPSAEVSSPILSVRDHPAFASEDASLWPLPDCDEGELAWIRKDQVESLNLWPGDRIFLRLLEERQEFFSLKLLYSGDYLLEAKLDEAPLSLA